MLDNHTYEKMVTFNSIVADLYSRQRSEKAIQAFLIQLKSFCFFEKGDVYIYRKEDDRIKFENFIYTGWGEELATYMKYCNLDDIVPILSVPQSIMFRSSDVFIASERKKSSYVNVTIRMYRKWKIKMYIQRICAKLFTEVINVNTALSIQLRILGLNGIKPNFSELARMYGLDRRTVKNIMTAMKASLRTITNRASWINTWNS